MKREPLPFPHRPHPHFPHVEFACQHPESGDERLVAPSECPGCSVYAVSRAVRNPNSIGLDRRGHVRTAKESVRLSYDDCHPLRVLFERALAERGIA